ncbi:coiled-coil domain-containing protein 190 isoform X2 [Brachyhypopomus gauderio]
MHQSEWMVWPKEAERRAGRRADAILAHGLQRLDKAKHYHLNTLIREQRTLQRHLLTIKTGSRLRGRQAVGLQPSNHELSHPPVSCKKTLLPIIPLAGGEPDRHRCEKPHSSYTLQARIQDFISSGTNHADSSPSPICLPGLKPQPTNLLPPAAPVRASRGREQGREQGRQQAVSLRATENEMHRPLWESVRGRHKDGQRENEPMMTRAREGATAKEMDRTVSSSPPLSPLLSPLLELSAPDGHLRTVHTLPDFAQAMMEARKARYIRHRVQPFSERELSITEIFSRNTKDINTTH